VFFPDAVMADTATKAQRLGSQWINEAPERIHSSAVADDGSPQWHPDFARWLTRSDRPPALADDPTMRTTRVMRQLRKLSKREYEVVYRVLVLKDTIAGVTRWLNERAAANGIAPPPGRRVHYTEKDALALFIAGVDWADFHW
jgi:hypothetical protein